MTDFRALCAELVEKLDELNCHYNVPSQSAMIERACAALADESASVIGEPSFDELRNLWANAPCIDEAPGGVAFARAVLARWGNPAPQPPAEGEVEELVAWLRDQDGWMGTRVIYSRIAELLQRLSPPQPPADGEVAELVRWLRSRAGIPASPDFPAVVAMLTRAADLLEQRHPAPVAVSERLPGPEDCDEDGRCWWWRTDDADEWWELLCISDAREYNAGCGNARYTHWLPFTALPLPSGEVE